jgi:transcriptional regulator with XRE-family HTH domain
MEPRSQQRRRSYMTHGSLALRLRVLRAERALTIERAASRAGVTPETISDAERGRRHPYLPTLRKLAAAYSVPVEHLIDTEEPALAAPPKAEAPSSGQAETPEVEPSPEDEERAARERIESSPRGVQMRNFRERIERIDDPEEMRRIRDEEYAAYARLHTEWKEASEEDQKSDRTATLASRVDMAHAFAFTAAFRLYVLENPDAGFVPVHAEIGREIAELVGAAG